MCLWDTEIRDFSVINDRGRAPLIVVPDTGTRPQTKQDRPGAGCHAQSPSSKTPVCFSRGGRGGSEQREDTECLMITGEETSKET